MTIDKFRDSCRIKNQHFDDPILQSLYYLKQNEWDKSHDIAKDVHTHMGSYLHGLLHRIEGDDWNARYWYSQAGKKGYIGTVDDEWDVICQHYFKKQAR